MNQITVTLPLSAVILIRDALEIIQPEDEENQDRRQDLVKIFDQIINENL